MKIRSLVRLTFGANGKNRENDSRRNQADAVREAKSPGQHRDDRGDQEQQRRSLKMEFHSLVCYCPAALSRLMLQELK